MKGIEVNPQANVVMLIDAYRYKNKGKKADWLELETLLENVRKEANLAVGYGRYLADEAFKKGFEPSLTYGEWKAKDGGAL